MNSPAIRVSIFIIYCYKYSISESRLECCRNIVIYFVDKSLVSGFALKIGLIDYKTTQNVSKFWKFYCVVASICKY